MPGQLAFTCSCGATSIHAAGRCARCYRRHWCDLRLFNGRREAALTRDRACVVCGASSDLIVHHRRPSAVALRFLATLCRACHPRVHRWNSLPYSVSPFMRQLWREANPRTPEQLPLLTSESVSQRLLEQPQLF